MTELKRRVLTVDHSGNGIDQDRKAMSIADARATLDRMHDEEIDLRRRLENLEGKGGGSADIVDPEFFIPVDRHAGIVGGDGILEGSAPRALERRDLRRGQEEVLPEYYVPVDRHAGSIGGDE